MFSCHVFKMLIEIIFIEMGIVFMFIAYIYSKFELLATKVLDECHSSDPNKAIMLLDRKSPTWSQMTCLQIAAAANDQVILLPLKKCFLYFFSHLFILSMMFIISFVFTTSLTHACLFFV